MTMTMDSPLQTAAPVEVTTASAAERLRTTTAAIRVSFTWFGTRKTLTAEQKAVAAESFGAEGEFLSAGKKLIDTRHTAFKAVTAVKSRIAAYWKAMSLPYPEPGIRLIRQGDIDIVNDAMAEFKSELDEAVNGLDAQYDELKAAARIRLGSLFNPADYPPTLRGLFDVAWEFPSVEPPSYLMQLRPDLYEQETQRITARFDEAVALAEQAFTEELSKLVSHLAERLAGSDDGRPKVFRDASVENLDAFFERFRRLNIRSNEQLDDVVEQARRVMRGVQPQHLRDSGAMRRHVAAELGRVQTELDELLVDRPRRNILRRPR